MYENNGSNTSTTTMHIWTIFITKIKHMFIDNINQCHNHTDMHHALIRTCYHCSIDIKLLLFRSYYTPSYCSHLWINFNKATYNKLRVAYNNVYRRILGYSRRDSASNMCVTNRIDNFDTLIKKNVYNFPSRVQSILNTR